MNTPLTHRPDGNGASAEADPPAAVPSAAGVAAGYLRPGTWRGVGSQAAAALGMLTGLWGAILPWFITLQYAGGHAAAVNLISGLAVAAAGRVRPGWPARVRRPAVRQLAARPLADHRRAHPQPASTLSPTRCTGPT